MERDYLHFLDIAVCNSCEIAFLKIMDEVRKKLKKEYKELYDDFFINKDKKLWKIRHLSLKQFYMIHRFYIQIVENKIVNPCVKDIVAILATGPRRNPRYDVTDSFRVWREILKEEANQVIGNYVGFLFKNSLLDKNEDELKEFKEKTGNTILKSEIVEKNDGKASYILKRMFKAYIRNSHQLPDLGLKYILTSIQKNDVWNALKDSEKETFRKILQKLEKTMPDGSKADDWIEECMASNLNDIEFEAIKNDKSNEIRDALDDERKLSAFFSSLVDEKEEIKQRLFSEDSCDKEYLNGILRRFRAHLDNSVLQATPCWKSILTRGICDYIASLTDQEAVNEYDKLYAGIMELI
jgi:dGTP triphosphohydrolase